MSKHVSKAASMELDFLAALDSIHANVNTSEIAEIQDWSGAVRGKFHGASVKDASDPNAANEPVSSSRGVVLGASGNIASHGSVQYSQMATSQLIAACTSESSEGAWIEFVRRSLPVITAVITKIVQRFGSFRRDLVDDLSQDVFLKLCKNNFRALRGVETHHENAFAGFLKAVATHTAQDYFRSATSSRRGSGKAPEDDRVFLEFISNPNAASESEGITLEEIDRALKTLSHNSNFERDYKIFWLHYRNGLTAKAIAALPSIKLSAKGVETTLLRLTRRIRSALTQTTKKPK